MNLNSPTIEPGPLVAADLDRSINTGRIYHLHRAVQWPDTIPTQPAGLDYQGRHKTRPLPAEASSELLEDEPCHPPFTRIGLVLMLCTGLPLLVVIVWALVALMPAA